MMKRKEQKERQKKERKEKVICDAFIVSLTSVDTVLKHSLSPRHLTTETTPCHHSLLLKEEAIYSAILCLIFRFMIRHR